MFMFGDCMKCSRSIGRSAEHCWNHVQVPVSRLRKFLVSWFVERCRVSDSFRQILLEAIKAELRRQKGRRATERDVLGAKVKDLECQERNLRKSIRIAKEISGEEMESLVADLAMVTEQLRAVRCEASPISATPADYGEDEVLEHLAEVLAHLLETSFEMAEVVRGFVPRCVIVPVQSYETGQVYPRAKLMVRANMQNYDELTEIVVDLFEWPVPVRIMAEAVRLRSQTPQPTLKQIGAQLGVSYMSVKRALGYARLMQELGVTEPFRELYEKPEKASRWRDAS
jgi:hypothetical protein